MSPRPKVLTTTPLLVVSDLQRSIDFYGRLGFGEPGIWGEPPCFAMINRDGLELMLSLTEGASKPQPNGPHGVWDMYIRIADLDAELAALSQAGVAIDRGPVTTMYDMREIDIIDPDGYRICVAQNVE